MGIADQEHRLRRGERPPGAVILTLAIRGEATGELRMPKARYDPFALRN